MTPDQLAQLHQLCFDTPAPWPAAAFSQCLADDVCAFVTSEHAFMLGRLIGDEAEVLTLAVAPVARRQGAALALMTRFHAQATRRGVARIFLEVSAENLAAIALYQKLGYLQTGKRLRYYQPPAGPSIDALIMSVTLKSSKP